MPELKTILKEMDISDVSVTYAQYERWQEQWGDDALPEGQTGKMSMTADEIRDVAEVAIQKQLNEDEGVTLVEDEFVLTTLADKGFCQAFDSTINSVTDFAFSGFKNQSIRM